MRHVPARWLALLGALGVASVLTTIVALGYGRDPANQPSQLAGNPAPSFELVDLDGRPMSLVELRGRPVVLNFWATWCPPCRDEMPLLDAAQDRYREQGLVIVGILFEDSADDARRFLSTYAIGYPTLLDPGGRTAIDYGVFGLPETYFVDRGGTVRYRHIGAIDAATLDARIAEIMP